MTSWGPALALAFATLLTVALEPRLRALPQAHEDAAGFKSDARVPPEVRRALSLGYRVALADYDWLSAIQYFGSAQNEHERYGRLYGILDEATDLDPHFDYAYQFGGQSIPFHDPHDGLWYNTRQAISLLEKAEQSNTERWQIPWLLGFIRYTYWGDYARAGHDLERAAELADRPKLETERYAPPTYLRSLATRLLAQGNDVETAIATTQLALAEAVDDKQRDELQSRLNALQLQQVLQKLGEAADKLRAAGQAPNDLAPVAEAIGLPPPFLDPYGDPLTWGADGKPHSQNEDKLLRLYIHPGQPAIERAVD